MGRRRMGRMLTSSESDAKYKARGRALAVFMEVAPGGAFGGADAEECLRPNSAAAFIIMSEALLGKMRDGRGMLDETMNDALGRAAVRCSVTRMDGGRPTDNVTWLACEDGAGQPEWVAVAWDVGGARFVLRVAVDTDIWNIAALGVDGPDGETLGGLLADVLADYRGKGVPLQGAIADTVTDMIRADDGGQATPDG